jgi:hypothetical protein
VDAESFAQAVAAVPSVLLDTRFGQVLALQALALALAAATMASRPTAPMAAMCLAGIACLLEAGHSGGARQVGCITDAYAIRPSSRALSLAIFQARA